MTDTWTPERVEKLKEHHASGISFSLMASLIGGVSRNACIGKAMRLGLEKRGPSQPRPSLKPRVSKRVRDFPFLVGQRALPQPKPRVVVPEPSTNPVSIVQLKDEQCRWPVVDDDGGRHLFCSAETEVGRSYCPYHCAASYARTSPRMTEEERQLAHSRYVRRFRSIVTPHAPPLAPEDFAA